MLSSLKTSALAAFVLTMLASIGPSNAASSIAGFGPTVSGDSSLDANVTALATVINRQNSPEGDVYKLALSTPAPEMPFESVAMESGSVDTLAAGPEIFNDLSLNASSHALARVIAWQQSPEGDAFAYAIADHVKGVDFERVALASVPSGGFASNEE